jgi:thioester reductase-like protein
MQLLHRLYDANIAPRKIYVLIRPPSSYTKLDPSLRHPNLEIIPSDPTLPLFGLTPLVYARLSDEVDVVLHLAADTRFLMSLEDAINSNVSYACGEIHVLGCS